MTQCVRSCVQVRPPPLFPHKRPLCLPPTSPTTLHPSPPPKAAFKNPPLTAKRGGQLDYGGCGPACAQCLPAAVMPSCICVSHCLLVTLHFCCILFFSLSLSLSLCVFFCLRAAIYCGSSPPSGPRNCFGFEASQIASTHTHRRSHGACTPSTPLGFCGCMRQTAEKLLSHGDEREHMFLVPLWKRVKKNGVGAAHVKESNIAHLNSKHNNNSSSRA